jgi:hypothetical protein
VALLPCQRTRSIWWYTSLGQKKRGTLAATRAQGFFISTSPMASQLQVLSPHEFDRPASFRIRQEDKLNGNLINTVIY